MVDPEEREEEIHPERLNSDVKPPDAAPTELSRASKPSSREDDDAEEEE